MTNRSFPNSFIAAFIFVLTWSFTPVGHAEISNLRFVISDHLGTAKLLINEEGEVVWPVNLGGEWSPNESLPFGMDIEHSSNESQYKLTFTNKELETALQLHYFGARFYNSEICRFISPDPVGGTPENPISWNRYLYCHNDPINMFDPNGKVGMEFLIAGCIMAMMLTPENTNAPVITDDNTVSITPAKGIMSTILGVAITGRVIAGLVGSIAQNVLPGAEDKEVLTQRADPGELRLPPTRSDGADPFKLSEQMQEYGDSTEGMPPIQVTEGNNGEYMINDGVTRATRIDRYNQINGTNQQVEIEVIEKWSSDLNGLNKVKDQ